MPPSAQPQIGVAFLARGLHPDWQHAFQRFVTSYKNFPAGVPHRLYIIFKGFRDAEHLAEGQSYFADLPHVPIHTVDSGFDIGCYKRAAREMREEFVCFLNTKSEILAPNWLRLLAEHIVRPGVGLVGNTGSYESLQYLIPGIPKFPNPHIRTNGFLIRREGFLRIADRFDFSTKTDGWMFECGPESLSQQISREGLQLLVVDRHGQGYGPAVWQDSHTYCTPNAAPLIGDDTYRKYLAADAMGRREMAAIMWGPATAEARIRASYDRPHASEECDEDDAITPESFRPLMRIIRRVAGEKRVDELKRLLASLLHRPSSAA